MTRAGADKSELQNQYEKSMECIKHHKHSTEDDGTRLLKMKCLEPFCENEGVIGKGVYYQLKARSGA